MVVSSLSSMCMVRLIVCGLPASGLCVDAFRLVDMFVCSYGDKRTLNRAHSGMQIHVAVHTHTHTHTHTRTHAHTNTHTHTKNTTRPPHHSEPIFTYTKRHTLTQTHRHTYTQTQRQTDTPHKPNTNKKKLYQI